MEVGCDIVLGDINAITKQRFDTEYPGRYLLTQIRLCNGDTISDSI